MRKSIIILGATVLLATGCDKEEPKVEDVRLVKTIKIEDPSQLQLNVFSGRAEAEQEVNLAFQVAGTIVERPIHKGDRVSKGQLLAKLDPRDFQSELDAAEAELSRSKAYYDRIVEALKVNAVALQDLTDAEARLEQTRANVSIKQKALEDSVITAPYDGVIAQTYKENFQRVSANEVVLRLLDISEIKFTISIPESMISKAPTVETVDLRFDAFPNEVITAQVKEIGTEATAATRTYPITLNFKQPHNATILPGMTGVTTGGTLKEGTVKVNQNYTIPLSAIFAGQHPGTTFVWKIEKGTMTVKLQEVTQIRTTPEGAEVKGVEKGDWIVTAGTSFLKEGQQVKVLAK